METACKNALQAAEGEIKNGLTGISEIVVYLYSKFLISDDERESITHSSNTKFKQVEELLKLIRGGNQVVFEEFIKSLIFTRKSHVVTAINKHLEANLFKTVDIKFMENIRDSNETKFKSQALKYMSLPNNTGIRLTTTERTVEPAVIHSPPAESGNFRFPTASSKATRPFQTLSVSRPFGPLLLDAHVALKTAGYAPVLKKYDFCAKNCAILMIVNYEFPYLPENFQIRPGYQEDMNALNKIFDLFGSRKFLSGTNLNANHILQMVAGFVGEIEASTEPIDGSAVFIVTHGKDADIQGVAIGGVDKNGDRVDDALPLSKMIKEFSPEPGKCPKLAHKPKLFFIEACRGESFSQPFDGSASDPNLTPTNRGRTISLWDDMLLAFSTGWGHYAADNATIGSFFMRALSQVLNNRDNTGCTIEEILKKVNIVVCDLRSKIDGNNIVINNINVPFAQSPGYYSHLNGELVLFPKRLIRRHSVA